MMKTPECRIFDLYSSKRVSFILVTRNRAEYLRKSLELQRELIGPDDELIVIDGDSSDNTAEIAEQYADLINIFISEPDRGPNDAWNKGILLSRGKYIKQLTDDDTIRVEGMAQAIEVMEKHPEVDLLVCGGTRQRGDNLSSMWVPPGTNYGDSVKEVFKYGASGIGQIIRRSAFSKIGLFDIENLASDREFALRAISLGANVKFCRINLYHHQVLDHSVTIAQARLHESHSYGLVKKYSSQGYYFQYRLSRFLRKRPALYRLLSMPSNVVFLLKREGVRGATRTILQTLLRKKPAPPSEVRPGDCTWDGGFS